MKLVLNILVFVIWVMSFSTTLVFATQIIPGTEGANPWVDNNAYYDHRKANDSMKSPLPATGKAMYYSKGLFEKVLASRVKSEKFPICDNCVGLIAMLRDGDRRRKVCINRKGQPTEGPFLVADVAGDSHKKQMIEKEWVADVDYETAIRWGVVNKNSPIITIVECPDDILNKPSPKVLAERLQPQYINKELTYTFKFFKNPPNTFVLKDAFENNQFGIPNTRVVNYDKKNYWTLLTNGIYIPTEFIN